MGAQLGHALRKLRKESGYTLEQVARAAEISAAALSLFETGKRNPSPKVLGLIAGFLDCPVEPLQQLLDEERSADRLEVARYWYDASEGPEAGQGQRVSAPQLGEIVTTKTGEPEHAAQPVFSRRPIADLFGPEEEPRGVRQQRGPSASEQAWAVSAGMRRRYAHDDFQQYMRDLRDLATGRVPSGSQRYAVVEELGEQASFAIRTLRGLVGDRDPIISQLAERLLRELDVAGPQTKIESEEDEG